MGQGHSDEDRRKEQHDAATSRSHHAATRERSREGTAARSSGYCLRIHVCKNRGPFARALRGFGRLNSTWRNSGRAFVHAGPLLSVRRIIMPETITQSRIAFPEETDPGSCFVDYKGRLSAHYVKKWNAEVATFAFDHIGSKHQSVRPLRGGRTRVALAKWLQRARVQSTAWCDAGAISAIACSSRNSSSKFRV